MNIPTHKHEKSAGKFQYWLKTISLSLMDKGLLAIKMFPFFNQYNVLKCQMFNEVCYRLQKRFYMHLFFRILNQFCIFGI